MEKISDLFTYRREVLKTDSEDLPFIINPSWYVTEWSKPVYAWNDTDAPKVALLDRGTQFPILRDEGDWYVISLRGAVGWIHKD